MHCKNFILAIFFGSLDVLVPSRHKYLKCLSWTKDLDNASKFPASICRVRKHGKHDSESPGLIFVSHQKLVFVVIYVLAENATLAHLILIHWFLVISE